jgi:site-specific recombinase XerD
VLVELAYALGWRRGELLGFRVDGVDLLAGTLRIPTKNGQPREAALTERLAAFVQPLLSGKKAATRECLKRSTLTASVMAGGE